MKLQGWHKPTDIAFLEVKGPDAVRYLNGQVTNDIKGDLSNRVVPACLCTIKGKVQAFVQITAGSSSDSLLIQVEKDQSEAVFNRLDRYLIADDCELSEADGISVVHIISEDTPSEGARVSWRYGAKGFDYINTDPEIGSLAEFSKDEILLSRILHGIPSSEYELACDAFPSELGLDKWAVNFRKGCYLGQEIVSRLESVGKAKNRLMLFSTPEKFEAGTEFKNNSDKTVARVIRESISDPENSDRFLTSVFGKNEFTKDGFQEVAIDYPSVEN